MKAPLLASLLMASNLFGQETATAPLTGDDIAQILELRAHKEKVSFGQPPKYVTLRVESGGRQLKDFVLPGLTSYVTLLTYVPTEGGSIKPLYFWLSGELGRTSSSFSIDTSKTKFTKSGVFDGIYTITASDSKEMKDAAYRIQVLTSDTKPSDAVEPEQPASPPVNSPIHVSPAPPLDSKQEWHSFAAKDVRDVRFYSSVGGFQFRVGDSTYSWEPEAEEASKSASAAISASASVLSELRQAKWITARVQVPSDPNQKDHSVIRLTFSYPDLNSR